MGSAVYVEIAGGPADATPFELCGACCAETLADAARDRARIARLKAVDLEGGER